MKTKNALGGVQHQFKTKNASEGKGQNLVGVGHPIDYSGEVRLACTNFEGNPLCDWLSKGSGRKLNKVLES